MSKFAEDDAIITEATYQGRHEANKRELLNRDIPDSDICTYFYENALENPNKTQARAEFRRSLCLNKRKVGILDKTGLYLMIFGGIISLYFGLIDQSLTLSISTIITVVGLIVFAIGLVLKFAMRSFKKDVNKKIESEFVTELTE